MVSSTPRNPCIPLDLAETILPSDKPPPPFADLERSYASFHPSYHVEASQDFNNNPPTLDHFITFIEKKQFEFNDPSYARNPTISTISSTPQAEKLRFKTALIVQSKPKAEYTRKRVHLPLHPSRLHLLSDCRTFVKKPYQEKREFIIGNKRCFSSLEPLMEKDCSGRIVSSELINVTGFHSLCYGQLSRTRLSEQHSEEIQGIRCLSSRSYSQTYRVTFVEVRKFTRESRWCYFEATNHRKFDSVSMA